MENEHIINYCYKKVFQEVLENHNTKGIYQIPLPTSIGKTYYTSRIIADKLIKETDSPIDKYIITTPRLNGNYEIYQNIMEYIDEYARVNPNISAEKIKEKVVILHSQENTTLNYFSSEEKIQKIKKLIMKNKNTIFKDILEGDYYNFNNIEIFFHKLSEYIRLKQELLQNADNLETKYTIEYLTDRMHILNEELFLGTSTNSAIPNIVKYKNCLNARFRNTLSYVFYSQWNKYIKSVKQQMKEQGINKKKITEWAKQQDSYDYMEGHEFWHFMKEVFPETRINKAKVIILTHAKYMAPNGIDTLVNKIRRVKLFDKSFLEKYSSMLIVDEIDTLKANTLDALIGSRATTNILEVLEIFSDSCKKYERYDKAFLNIKTTYKNKQTTFKELLANISKNISEIYEQSFAKYHLDIYTKLHSDKMVFYYTNDNIDFNISSDENRYYLKIADNKSQLYNEIVYGKKDDKSKDILLTHFIGKIDAKLRYVGSLIFYMAMNFYYEKDSSLSKNGQGRKNIDTGEDPFHETFRTFLKYMHIRREDASIIMQYVFSIISSIHTAQNHLDMSNSKEMYDTPISVINVKTISQDIGNIGIFQDAFSSTPENILYEIAKYSLVVGLSATATCSCVSNFNWDWISKRLEMDNIKCKIICTEEELTKGYKEQIKGYEKYNLETECICVNPINYTTMPPHICSNKTINNISWFTLDYQEMLAQSIVSIDKNKTVEKTREKIIELISKLDSSKQSLSIKHAVCSNQLNINISEQEKSSKLRYKYNNFIKNEKNTCDFSHEMNFHIIVSI